MTNIVDTGTFDDVPLIEKTDKVEGGLGGDSNKQGVALANRTQFLRAKLTELSEGIGSLNPADIGAEPKGVANSLLTLHVQDPNAHPTYLSKEEAITKYLAIAGSNLANGAVVLNANGKIPAELIDMVQSSYVIVADKAARLALPTISSLTIAVQADEDRLYYLNGNLSAATEANWITGQSATVSGVSRVFNRTGVITAQAGDYNTEQITETANKTFITPAEREAFNAKQGKLVSGTNIKTVAGISVVGEGDVPITPASINAAEKTHKHVAADITDFVTVSKDTTGGMIKAGEGVTVAYDTVKKLVTIASTQNADGTQAFNSVSVLGMIAGQIQTVNFAAQSKYNMIAQALKKEAGASGISYLAESFTPTTIGNYLHTPGLSFTDPLTITKGGLGTTVKDGALYSILVSNQYASVTADTVTTESIVPVLSSATSAPGYTPFGSDFYSQGADQRPAWYAFNDDPSTGYISKNAAASNAPVYVGIQLPVATKVYAYQFSNRSATSFNNNPMTFRFEGSNDGTTYVQLDARNESAAIANNPGIDRRYALSAVAEYKYYRLAVTATGTSGSTLLNRFKIFGFGGENVLIKAVASDKNFTITNNALVEVTGTLNAELIRTSGINHIALTQAMLTSLGGDFKLMSGNPTGLQNTIVPLSQIVISNAPRAMDSYGAISKATLVATVAGAGKVTAAFSRNMTDWYVYNSGWVKVATPTTTAASADALLANGMTIAQVGAITQAQWAELFGGPDAKLDSLAIAFALSAPAVADTATIKSMTYTVSETDSWKVQTPAEVEIRWRPTSVSFKAVTAGDYKFIYQAP